MQTLFQDIHYGIRMLAKRPGFTAVAIITLALGIGANSVIFSVINSVLLRPLPYQDHDRLVMLWENDAQEGNDRNPVAPANFIDWQKQNEVCSQLAYFRQPEGITVTGGAEPERITGMGVSPSLFSLLGVQPVQGRSFLTEDKDSAAGFEVIISYGLWQRRFGGDAEIIGRSITLDGLSFTVIGVMPPNFQLPEESELWWKNFDGTIETMRDRYFLRVVGRLKPEATLQQAQSDFAVIAEQLEQQYPETNTGRGINVIPMRDQFVGNVRPALLILLGAVGFVLLIACANVANLLLAQAAARQKEMAIRVALGASRFRLVRQLLAESLLLMLAGGTLGLLLAVWGVDLLVALGSTQLSRWQYIGVDALVLGFTSLVTLLTGIIFGLAPALYASKPDVHESLKKGGHNSTDTSGRRRMRSLLVVTETAIAMVLLIGAGLMIRSFIRLQAIAPGFDPQNVLTMQFSLPALKYPDQPEIATFYRQIIERLEAMPGVRSAAAISRLPLAGDRSTTGITIEGRPVTAAEQPEVHFRIITPSYFRTMNIPLQAGREFDERDALNEKDGEEEEEEENREEESGVVMVNESLARRYWPGESAVGKRIKLGSSSWVPVVGVVKDARNFGLDAEAQPEVYISYLQNAQERMRVVVRTETDPSSLVPAVRQAVRDLDKDLAFSQVATLEQLLERSSSQRRMNMLLLGVFAALALLMAAVGIYGVISYSVTQRTREIGIRQALGARPRDVVMLIVGQGMMLALAGIAIGIAGAVALTRLMESLLYEVSATDAATFVIIPLILAGVALGATLVPARRAMKVDPMVALRYE